MMKRLAVIAAALILCASLSSCNSGAKPVDTAADTDAVTVAPAPKYEELEPIGEVAAEFADIVSENRFANAHYADGRVFASVPKYGMEISEMTDFMNNFIIGYDITTFDGDGNETAKFSVDFGDEFHNAFAVIPTSDGGYLYSVGFTDALVSTGAYKSAEGFASNIVKVDAEGAEQWRYDAENYLGTAVTRLYERDGEFFVIGVNETPDTREAGNSSPTDVTVIKLDANGELAGEKSIGGSSFDMLWDVAATDAGFDLYVFTQSTDGDFSETGNYIVSLAPDLDYTVEKSAQITSNTSPVIGRIGGEDVRSDDTRLADFTPDSAGTPTLVFDRGDEGYLVVSSRAVPVETEDGTPDVRQNVILQTVYTFFGADNAIVWRASVANEQTSPNGTGFTDPLN